MGEQINVTGAIRDFVAEVEAACAKVRYVLNLLEEAQRAAEEAAADVGVEACHA